MENNTQLILVFRLFSLLVNPKYITVTTLYFNAIYVIFVIKAENVRW